MNAPAMSPVELVEGQFQAYNSQDLDAFCSFFADDAELADFNGAVTAGGIEAIRARHAKLFSDFPQNKASLLHRMVVGTTVIDHEHVERAPGGQTFQVAAIYTIAGGKVARVDYVK
jgi:hypothetical protein